MENTLVRQKDEILRLINDGQYELATTLLNFTAEMWAEFTYTYKTLELKERIRREILCKIENAHWKQEAKWRAMLARA